MPSELHFSLFPGLDFNRDEVGEWSLGLGLSPQSQRSISLGNENNLAPRARELMSRIGDTVTRLGTSLFAPHDTTQREWNALMGKANSLEASLSAQVASLEPQSGIHRGNARALQRLTEDFQDFRPAEEQSPTAPIDTPELVHAREQLSELRSLRASLESLAEQGGVGRPLLVSATVQLRLLTGDPDGALDTVRAERRDHPETEGVSEMLSSLEFAKRRYAAQIVLQACDAAVSFEAENVSEYRAGLLRNAVAPGIARFQDQVEHTERPITDLINDLYGSDQHFGSILRERGFGQIERVIASGGTFHEMDTLSAGFRRQFETSTAERYTQFLFDLTGVFAQSNEAFLKNVSTVIGYRIAGRIASNVVMNAAVLPVVFHQNHLTLESYGREFLDNLAFSGSMTLVPRLNGIAGHAASIGAMTAYTYVADPESRGVNPFLALVYQAGQHALGRLGHVSAEQQEAEMAASRAANARLAEVVNRGWDVASSLGNNLIGSASIVAQRGLESISNATKNLAVASAALAGCNAESVGSTLSIGAFAGLWVLNLAMAAGRVRSLRSEAARRTESITPEIFEHLENTLIGVENPEIARGREMASVERIIANLTIQHVRTLTHPRDPQFVAAPDLPMSVQTGTGHIEIVVPTNHTATRYPTSTALRDGIIEHIRGLSREEGLTIGETTVTNADTVAPRIFSLRGPSGEERVTIEISFQSAPPQGREARNIADRTPAIPLHRMAGIAGSTLLLGGCEAPGTPATVAITAGFLTAAALIGRAFSRHADTSEAARRNTAPMDPSTEIQIPNAPTAEQQIRSMTSRWRNVHLIEGASMVRARQDAAELARLRGRMNEQNTDVQIDYIERIAQFWATGDTEIRRTVNDVIQNAGTNLSEGAIRALCSRLLQTSSSTQAVAELAMFLRPESRLAIIASLMGVEGGVTRILNTTHLVTSAMRPQLAERAAQLLITTNLVNARMVSQFANGVNFESWGPLTRIVLNPRYQLDNLVSPTERRAHLLSQATPEEQGLIARAILPPPLE